MNTLMYYTPPQFYLVNLQHSSNCCKHIFSIRVENRLDPDQMASSDPTMFSQEDISRFSRLRVKNGKSCRYRIFRVTTLLSLDSKFRKKKVLCLQLKQRDYGTENCGSWLQHFSFYFTLFHPFTTIVVCLVIGCIYCKLIDSRSP